LDDFDGLVADAELTTQVHVEGVVGMGRPANCLVSHTAKRIK